jgi:hypothetical protein
MITTCTLDRSFDDWSGGPRRLEQYKHAGPVGTATIGRGELRVDRR